MNVSNYVDDIVRQVTAWDGITSAPHRFGGTEFNLGAVEVGHVHRNGMVDIPFTRRLRAQLVPAGEAELHHLLPESGWITFYVRHPEDVDQAVRLFRLSYLQKSRRRGIAGETLRAELDSLSFPAAVNAVLTGSEHENEEDSA